MTIIASFDIGKKNFAFYVEEVNEKFLEKLSEYYWNLPKKMQRKVKGPMNKEVSKILFNLCKKAKCIDFGVFDIRQDKESNDLDIATRRNMHNLLESYRELWDACDIIIIEQQFFNTWSGKKRVKKTPGSGANVDAIKLAECCLNWFLLNYDESISIDYFSATFKTQVLGAPDKQTKTERKKWAIQKGRSILESRGDWESIEYINAGTNYLGKKQKQDDIYDCVIMTQAYKMRNLVIG